MDQKDSWNRFRRLKFDTKNLSKRARRAETLTTRHAHKFVLKRLASIRAARRKIINWLAMLLILITAVAVQMVWFQSGYQTTASVAGGTYAEGMLGPIRTLNPLYARSNAEIAASKLIFSSILDYDQTGHLRDNVATNVAVDRTGKIYTVTLRDDVRWHDGTLLTADDVVFTVNMMKHPEAGSIYLASWSGIEARTLDDHTVRFTLPSVYAAFPHALTFPILPSHILSDVAPGMLRENAFSISPIGSGPFTLRLLQTAEGGKDKIVYLSAWEQYYRGNPKLARFEIHGYETSDAIIDALKSRDINAALNINLKTDEVPQGFEKKVYPVSNGVYALFNTQSAVLKNKNVRKALQAGTDVAAVRKTLDVTVPPLNTPVLPSQVEGASLPAKPVFSPENAQRLLNKAGWKLKRGETVRTKKKDTLRLEVVAVKDSQYSKVVENLAKQWRSLGFEVVVSEFDPDQAGQSFAESILQPRAYDVLINELAIGADPDVFAYWHSSQASPLGRNFSNYRSEIADDILVSARLRSEEALRAQKYRRFVNQWYQDAPALGLYQSVMEYVMTTRIQSVQDNAVLPTPTERYSNILYWTADQAQVYKTP